MRRVGLLDDEGKTTALANDWRLDNKYKEVCDTIVQNIYPTELLELFPDSDVDRSSVRSWFMGHGVGEGAADKMVALFVLLKEGKIKEKKVTTNKSTSSAKTRKNPIGSDNHHTEANPPVSNDVPKNKNSNDFSNRPNLHIDLQIHISPDSTAEQIETIFASMAKHFYGADNS